MSLKIKEVDNRDVGTTWLWIEGLDDYVEVNIGELLDNVHENMLDACGNIETENLELAMAIEIICKKLGVAGYERS